MKNNQEKIGQPRVEQTPQQELPEKAVRQRKHFASFLERATQLTDLKDLSSLEEKEEGFFNRSFELVKTLEKMEGLKLSTAEKISLAQTYQTYLAEMTIQCEEAAVIFGGDASLSLFPRVTALLTDNLISISADELAEYHSLEEKNRLTPEKKKRRDKLNRLFKLLNEQLTFWSEFPYDNYEPIIPELEIKKIKGTSKEKEGQMEEIKRRLSEQQATLAQLQLDLIDKMRLEKIDPQQTLAEINFDAWSAKLSPQQISFFKQLAEKLASRQRLIAKLLENYPGPKEFFEQTFNNQPNGPIEVYRDSASICFQCFAIEDFARLLKNKFQPNQLITKHDITEAKQTYGCLITHFDPEYVFTADNASNINESSSTMIHENQHAINALIMALFAEAAHSENQRKIIGQEGEIQSLKQYLRFTRDSRFAQLIADEIIAYYNEDKPFEMIENQLICTWEEGGIYDYIQDPIYKKLKKWILDKIAKTVRATPDSPETKELFDKIFYEEKERMIKQALDALKLLEEKGFSRDEIIYMVLPQKLNNWHKIARRMFKKGALYAS